MTTKQRSNQRKRKRKTVSVLPAQSVELERRFSLSEEQFFALVGIDRRVQVLERQLAAIESALQQVIDNSEKIVTEQRANNLIEKFQTIEQLFQRAVATAIDNANSGPANGRFVTASYFHEWVHRIQQEIAKQRNGSA